MTLYQIINTLKQIALTQPNVKSATDGSVYEVMNANPSVKYNVVHFSQTTHQSDEEFDYYGLNIFYISRLEDSLEDNRLQIQSIGKEILDNIIRTFCENWNIEFPTITYYPFTQKFADLCAGAYCNVRLEVPKEIICADDFIGEIIPSDKNIRLQDISITITQNGLRVITPAAGYDGIGEITINTEVPQELNPNLEYKEVEYTQNGEFSVVPGPGYDGIESVAITVDVPTGQTINNQYKSDYLTEANFDFNADDPGPGAGCVYELQTGYTYDSGYTGLEEVGQSIFINASGAVEFGKELQKLELSSTSFTGNNTYENANGWSSVTVDVPITYDRYDEGFEDGEEAQKEKLTTLYADENGTYTRTDGYSSITVDVAQTGYTQQDIDDAYNRGYQDGLEACQQLPVTATSITINVASAITDSGTASTTVNPSAATTNLTYSSSDTTKATINGTTGAITVKANGTVQFCVRDSVSNLSSCKNVNVTKTQPITAFTYTADTSLVAYSGENRTIKYSTSGFNISSIGFDTSNALHYSWNKSGNTITVTFPYNYYGEQQSYYVKLTGYTTNGTLIQTRINYTQEAYPNKGKFVIVYNVTSTTVPTQLFYDSSGCHPNCIENTLYSAKLVSNNANIPLTSATYTFPSTGKVSVEYTLNGGVLGHSTFFGCSKVLEAKSFTGVKVINYYAFANCSALSSVTLNNDLLKLGSGTEKGPFRNCTALTTITIPNSLTELPEYCFEGCTSLTSVTIGTGCSVIYAYSFQDTGLQNLTIYRTKPPTLRQNAFYNVTSLTHIYVPAESVNTYKTAAGWSDYASIITAIS